MSQLFRIVQNVSSELSLRGEREVNHHRGKGGRKPWDRPPPPTRSVSEGLRFPLAHASGWSEHPTRFPDARSDRVIRLEDLRALGRDVDGFVRLERERLVAVGRDVHVNHEPEIFREQ